MVLHRLLKNIVLVSLLLANMQSYAQENTTFEVENRGVIPVNDGVGELRITNNDSSNSLHNVHVILPFYWKAVIQDSSDCNVLLPKSMCTLKFSSTEPYISKGKIKVVADEINHTTSPTTALAFSIGGDLVFDLDPYLRIATVVDFKESSKLIRWGEPGVRTYARNIDNGKENTDIIINTPSIGVNAAAVCHNKTTGGVIKGTWYLPALSQIASYGSDNNIDNNLVQLGFTKKKEACWTSTEFTSQEAWISAYQDDENIKTYPFKREKYHVRCVRDVNY